MLAVLDEIASDSLPKWAALFTLKRLSNTAATMLELEVGRYFSGQLTSEIYDQTQNKEATR
jgi:hypothetical protein